MIRRPNGVGITDGGQEFLAKLHRPACRCSDTLGGQEAELRSAIAVEFGQFWPCSSLP
jgi:hypothetical protein